MSLCASKKKSEVRRPATSSLASLRSMDEKRREFAKYLVSNAHKARCTLQPTAHLHFYDPIAGNPNPTIPLVAMSKEDVLSCPLLNRESELVRWLLHQMTTYDCHRQKIVALAFDRDVVLSEVLVEGGGRT